jgi:glutamyl-tRNA reductase
VPVLVLGLNYKTAPVGLLERAAVPADRLSKALRALTDRAEVDEAVVLSTCNRVEVYAQVRRYHAGMAALRGFLCEWAGLAPEDLDGLPYDYFDDRAAAHLFAVTSGIDSMVVGERQIAMQVKQAFLDAEREGAAGRVLSSLFRQALRVGKRARAETGISDGAASMVDVGLEAARQVLGTLDDRRVLLIGAGKVGGMAARRLREEGAELVVANRTSERGATLAERVGAAVLDLSELPVGLRSADLVLCSTGASQPVIDQDQVAAAMTARPDRPLVLLDIAVPRDVDPGCAFVPGVTVLDVDAVRALTDTGGTGEEVAKARAIVEAEAQRFAAWTRSVRVEPTIVALRTRGEDVRRQELERLRGKLAQLDPRSREAVEALTRGIVNTLLHEPTVRLKSVADARGGDLYAAALRELFDLPDEA